MYRFFVDKKELNYFILDQSILNHLKSIRLKINENFICVYEGKFYICSLENKKAKIIQLLNEDHEYPHRLVLFAPIIKIKNFEWLIQKATELGVQEFYPLICENTNKKYLEIVKNKLIRFQEIAKNAAEQSFRNQVMKIFDPINFIEAVEIKIENKFLAHEKIDPNQTDQSNNFNGNIAFFVGPEGGFSDNEVEIAQKNNTQIISMGKRILRSETAVIWLISNVKE